MQYAPEWEFYDLKKDPNEDRNAIHDPAYQQEIVRLKKRLREVKAENGDGIEANAVIDELVRAGWK